MKVLPGGDLLVLEKQGAIRRVATNGTVSTVGTIDVTGCAGGERGLLSAAIDPSFATNGVIYVYATRPTGVGCANTLSKFTISGGTIVPGSEVVLIDNIVWAATNHNGGSVEVGRDGFLYLSVGEGAVDVAGTEPGVARRQDPARHDERSTRAGQPVPRPPPVTARAPASDSRPRSAKRSTPTGCATRSASRSTRTRRPPGSGSTTSAPTPGRR